MTIPAEGKALVKTEIAIALPEGCYGRVGEKEVMEDRASSVNLFVCLCFVVCLFSSKIQFIMETSY